MNYHSFIEILPSINSILKKKYVKIVGNGNRSVNTAMVSFLIIYNNMILKVFILGSLETITTVNILNKKLLNPLLNSSYNQLVINNKTYRKNMFDL